MNTGKAVLLFLVVGLVSRQAYKTFVTGARNEKVQSEVYLQGIASEFNKRLPMHPEPGLVLYRVDAAKAQLTYNYRLENVDARMVTQPDLMRLRNTLLTNTCKNEGARKGREQGIAMRIQVVDRTGTPITTVAVLPNTC